jgi:hypothetical protein
VRNRGRNIIVIGTSAGGLDALDNLIGQLPSDLPASIFHSPAHGPRKHVAQVNGLGTLVPYNCPNCGGVLWEIDSPDLKRYRCHTGHSFTVSALLASQSEKIEETLWPVSTKTWRCRKSAREAERQEFIPKIKSTGDAARAAKT